MVLLPRRWWHRKHSARWGYLPYVPTSRWDLWRRRLRYYTRR
jgi:hypothetical protein